MSGAEAALTGRAHWPVARQKRAFVVVRDGDMSFASTRSATERAPVDGRGNVVAESGISVPVAVPGSGDAVEVRNGAAGRQHWTAIAVGDVTDPVARHAEVHIVAVSSRQVVAVPAPRPAGLPVDWWSHAIGTGVPR